MKPNAFDVLKIMSEKNLDISAAVELTNFVRQEKKKGGLVTVGVADPKFTQLINQVLSNIKKLNKYYRKVSYE